MADIKSFPKEAKTRKQALRNKCLDCSCWQPSEVRLCPAKGCPLWPWRMGKNPYYKPSEAQSAQAAALGARAKKQTKKVPKNGP